MSTATGLLAIEEAADQLELDPLSVHRLVARGRLKAGALPGTRPDGPLRWRVSVEEINRYVLAGSQDWRDLRREENQWDTNIESGVAEQLARAVIRAARDQRLSDGMIEADGRRYAPPFQRNGVVPVTPAATLIVELRVTPAIRALLDGPVATPFRDKQHDFARFGNWGGVWIGEALRLAIRLLHREARDKKPLGQPMLPTPTDWLYSSPDLYRATIAVAVQRVRDTGIEFVERSRFPDRGEGPLDVTVTYRLKTAAWADAARIGAAADILF